ncbi:MAG: DinB family protein [Paralcaligenes sp.]
MSTHLLTHYNAWADTLMFSSIKRMPEGEATKNRPTRFKNIIHTINHIYVIDCMFKAHLEGRPHHFTARNTPTDPPLSELCESKNLIDQWFVDYAASLSTTQLEERVSFQFVDGGAGIMSREEMILHIVNHATYHRGIVVDLMYQVPHTPPVTDLTVFLRDIVRVAESEKIRLNAQR